MSLSYAKNWPLVVDAPNNWKVEYTDFAHLGLHHVQSFKFAHVDDGDLSY